MPVTTSWARRGGCWMRLRSSGRHAACGRQGGASLVETRIRVSERRDYFRKKMQSIEKPTCVAIAIVEHEGRFLVGVRSAGIPLAGLAEFPGGKVHDGETAATAAVRECREETGLQVVVDREFFSTTHRYDHGLLEIHFFLCRLAPGERSTPISSFRWVMADELAMLEFPAANAPVTEMLLGKATPAPQST
jgi:8-oxo-dGTP diphosphatase